MDVGKALVAGMTAGAVMSVILALARILGMPVNMEMLLGTMAGLDAGFRTWLLGFAFHLAISATIGVIYAAGFDGVTHRAGALIGMGFSLFHIAFAGIIVGVLPELAPRTPAPVPPPGPFFSNLGLGAVFLFVLVHVVYGGIVGVLYHPEPQPRTGAQPL